MKKLIALFMCSMVLCLGGCSSDNTNGKVGIDLSIMSDTMAYSELSRILTEPDNYVGRKITLGGTFTVFTAESGTYPACVLNDATACCTTGLEFITKDGTYPSEGSIITVCGYLDSYVDEVDGGTYYHLTEASVSNTLS